jgi:hypothetical protein
MRPARVVADRAAQRAARPRRGVRPEPQPEPSGLALQVGDDHSGLHHRGARLGVDREDAVEVPRRVEHDTRAHCIARDRGAGPAHRHRDALLARDAQHVDDVVAVRGNTTARGATRYTDASVEYSARRRVPVCTSAAPPDSTEAISATSAASRAGASAVGRQTGSAATGDVIGGFLPRAARSGRATIMGRRPTAADQ